MPAARSPRANIPFKDVTTVALGNEQDPERRARAYCRRTPT